ncbi:putative fermentation associated protein (Csf1) [Aspergillus ruber CBS 135680]|uniref:Fermentation associated protein n=1 Tax=Aspergillus ruber (strain CBS 135680) TaxID=1388766 RepID=A0A017SH31_ASPRC|nr:uncharacterized protein EURHEDRAFT_377158 [Aspergillus ruber CBS 135680]EYE95575.1 hypothetical protein EURHEDRAFT_377158 [Aspergillus ruber CBS 135680]
MASDSTSLTTLSLTPDPSFNWFFLLELIVSCLLVLFFLLYFNRLFATLLSYGIRAYTWHYYRAYVDIHALQVSLLGGRVFFKGLRYHGSNETIFIHGGFITWHYWKHTVKRTELSNFKGTEAQAENRWGSSAQKDGDSDDHDTGLGEQGGVKKTDTLPCRITAKFYGLEWFIYNRTPAYDSILAGFNIPTDDVPSAPSLLSVVPQNEQHAENGPASSKEKSNAPSASSLSRSERDCNDAPENSRGHGLDDNERSDTGGEAASSQEIGDSLSKLLHLLPLKLVCDKGAIVMGNQHTTSVLTTTFDGATGSIEASDAGPLDLYRQIFSFQFSHPIIQMRPNPDYKQNQLAAAKILSSAEDDLGGVKRKRDTIFNYQRQKRKVWHSVRDLIPYFQRSVESFHVQDKNADTLPKGQHEAPSDFRWAGLSRYLDESSQDDHEEWNAVEYGRFSTILDTPSMVVSYFWDIPGCVPPLHVSPASSVRRSSPDINGAPPPEWGIDVKIEGGSINYGPWADRERVGLQNVFFPNFYRSSNPSQPLTVGDLRRNSIFKFRIELSDETTLRIPTREQSKDWQWKGRGNTIKGVSKVREQQRRQSGNKEGDIGHIGPDIRPFGWLSLRVAGNSTISYTMDMAGTSTEFNNQLDLDLRESRMSSSVNHGLLWQCPQQFVTCDLSTPLTWNDLRTWKFDIESQDMELFLLRDHIFLLTDLVSDWGSGPPQDYHTYVPFIYKMGLSFSNVKLFVNVNDMNIISNPSDLEDNRFLLINGRELRADVTIPLNKFKPEQNAIGFSANLRDGSIDFLTPLWDTFHSFLQDQSTATLESLSINGSYDYYLATSSELTDTLLLNVDGFSPKMYLFGFLIRYFMTVKENYFGEDMHFKTLEEFQELAYVEKPPNSQHGVNLNRKSNDLDVIVHVSVDSPCALLPEGIYDHSKCARLTAASLEADLRFTNYYMDLHFTLAPLKAALQLCQAEGPPIISEPQLFIEGFTVHGHRLFGLPPAEPTYVCNWDFGIGQIVGECSPEFLSCLFAGLQGFDMTFDNEENALPPLVPLALYDVTFLRAKVDQIHVSVLLEQTAFILSSGPLTVSFNDWADMLFSKRMKLLLPDLSIAAVDRKSVAHAPKLSSITVAPLALFQATIKLRMAQRNSDIGEGRRLQQEHIKAHDKRTQRTPWLLLEWESLGPNSSFTNSDSMEPPAIAIPSMPEPIAKGYRLDSLSMSYRPGTRSNASSKSFLVDYDHSSLRSVRKRRNQDTPSVASRHIMAQAKESSAHGENQDLRYPPRTAGSDRNSATGVFKRGATPATSTKPPSSWAMPAFSLYKVAFDTSQLPTRQVTSEEDGKESVSGTNLDPFFSPFGGDKTTDTSLACEFPTGVRGLCTPEFLLMLSALTKELQPKHPAEIIDSLQREVVSDIVGYLKALNRPNKSTSLAVRVPIILFKLSNASETPKNLWPSFLDEYNVEISNLKTEFRTKVERQKGDLLSGVTQSITVHAAAQTLSVSINGDRTDAYQERAELSCLLRDMDFWLVTAPSVRSHLQMRGFDTVTSTKSVEHLASLVHRTMTMLDSVTSAFQHSSSLEEKRLRFLIYSISQEAAGIADPAFLTRISYVLRVAPTHFRQHDSWKIISRIRNVYNHLPSDKQQALISQCLGDDISLPENAKSLMYSTFDQWRAWDLAHVEKSYVMRKIWNDLESTPGAPQESTFLSLAVGMFRFSIDPGPKESDFIVENMTTTISVGSRKDDSSRVVRSTNVVNVESYCSSSSVHLRWEIVDLIEGVLKAISSVTFESAPSVEPPSDKSEKETELHIVLGADAGSVILDGINIELALIGKSLRASVAQSQSQNKSDLCLLLSAEAGSTEISSRSTSLMLWTIANPYVYCSLMSEETEAEVSNELKIAGSCKRLRYDMRQDPVNLAHAADRIIEDEVRHIHRIVTEVNLPSSDLKKEAEFKKSGLNRLQVALFLDDYQLSFRLLPSLVYTISGEVARTSVMPSDHSKMEVDFDLKKNSHIFSSSDGDDILSVLEIPPINGRIVANMSPERTEVEADVTIELIYLEASAVRSLLSALSGPEMSHLVSDVKQNVEILQGHLHNILSLNKSPVEHNEPSTAPEILYKARLTMAGTKIHATAPGLNGKGYSADMDFSLGMMRMRLDNGFENGYPIEYPEFRVDASQIRLDLRKQEESGSCSYGSFAIGTRLVGTSVQHENGETMRAYHLDSKNFDVELYPQTAVLVVDIAAHLQERIKTLDLSHEVERFKKLRRRGQTESKTKIPEIPGIQVNDEPESDAQVFFNAIYTLDFYNIQIGWNMTSVLSTKSGRRPDDLVFSIKRVELSNKKKNAAKLRIEDMQLQMVPAGIDRRKRSLTSALLPELVFNVAYSSRGKEVRLAFQAAGKSLDLRATSDFIIPASMIRDTIASAAQTLRDANSVLVKPSADSPESPVSPESPDNNENTTQRKLFGNRRLRSVLVDVDFAGAIVSLQGRHLDDQQTMLTATIKGSRLSEGKYGQYVQGDPAATATLRAPGVALKVQFDDNGLDDPTLNAELKVDASTNILYPTLVPLIKQMTATVKELVGEHERPRRPSTTARLQPQKLMQETTLNSRDPDTILGRCRVNMGLLICKQEFSLSCQPIARVAATARFNSVYVTINTVQSDEQGRFLALLVAFNSLEASVKHVYSNDSTASFQVKSIIVSLMNSKHVSNTKGISAMLKLSPVKVALSAKQVQDLLLFREIWVPSSDEFDSQPTFQSQETETQTYIVQRYQQVASTSAFPWNTAIAVEKLEIQLDLGSTLGKAQFAIDDMWLSSKKNSEREQTLCVNFDTIRINSKGRMSGLVELRTLKVRTSIQWPDEAAPDSNKTPLIQASISFRQLQAKASFDYQPFLAVKIAMFNFLMYNVRGASGSSKERLFSILEGDQLQVYCTTLTASQSLALFQAWQRLVQDKQAAYEASLREVERYLRRRSSVVAEKVDLEAREPTKSEEDTEKAPISLQTGVVVTINSVYIGAFPSSFFDNQILKLEAHRAQAHFDVSLEEGRIHSTLGLTLGQLDVALSGIGRPAYIDIEELSVNDIDRRANDARGGTILKVPQLVASMETWQVPGLPQIDYVFRSTFEGKVDVGWNYSRISFIRDMWESHSRALASRLGKPLPPSAVRIEGGPGSEGAGDKHEQEKITAVVNMPQSKYTYVPLKVPVIDTPQLRDMGEATPPLEWIGLQRDKLPNITHQIIIVTLLEIAKEVEDAYAKILGSS